MAASIDPRSEFHEAELNVVSSSVLLSGNNAMPRGKKGAARHESSELRRIPTRALRMGDRVGRKDADDDKSIEKLANSIAESGIIEPVIVREVAGAEFEVIAGVRRLRAAMLLNLSHVPCIVRECSDHEALMISVTENLQRQDLNPIEKAYGLRRLLAESGLGQREIAARIGVSQSSIAHHLRLLALPEEVQELIRSGSLSMGHGKVLAGLEGQGDVVARARQCVREGTSVRDLEHQVSSSLRARRRRELPGPLPMRREEHELPNGLFILIKASAVEPGVGKIEIPYYTEDEKQWVLSVLSRTGAYKPEARRRD